METGLRRRAARDWPITQKKRGLEEPLWSVHDCLRLLHRVHPSTANRVPARMHRRDGEHGRPVEASSTTLRVYLVLKPGVAGGIRDGPRR